MKNTDQHQTTRKRNIWIDKQIRSGRPISAVAKEAGVPENKALQIVVDMQNGKLGPGRPSIDKSTPGRQTWEEKLGSQFRAARNRVGMTMMELVSKSKEQGIHADLISRFERGQKQPNMDQLQDMCRVLGITITEIWPPDRERDQKTELKRAGHLRPNEIVDVNVMLGRASRHRNEPRD